MTRRGAGLRSSPLGHKPLTRQRSTWEDQGEQDVAPGITARVWRRRVTDGTLLAFVDRLPMGWHMSISHQPASRYPSWDEIAHAREELLPPDLWFVMHLPTADKFVALHDTTFHLHEHTAPPEAYR